MPRTNGKTNDAGLTFFPVFRHSGISVFNDVKNVTKIFFIILHYCYGESVPFCCFFSDSFYEILSTFSQSLMFGPVRMKVFAFVVYCESFHEILYTRTFT
jgi:hypothetical protein